MKKKPKAKKPYPGFPLFLHQTGQWAKKVRGRMHYFGTDADAALAKYLDQRDDLQAGRTPRVQGDGLTVRDLANRFLTSKKTLRDSGELSPRTRGHYYSTCENLVEEFGKTRLVNDLASDDFEKLRTALAKTRGAHALAGKVQRVRTLFKYAWDEGIIDKPVRFGTTFKKPSKKVMRRARHETGPKMLEAADLRKVLDAAEQPLEGHDPSRAQLRVRSDRRGFPSLQSDRLCQRMGRLPATENRRLRAPRRTGAPTCQSDRRT